MILCFSGTGNSRHVADRLALNLHDTVVDIDPLRPLDGHCADRRVVWVFPVHAWSVPPVVADYMLSVPDGYFPADALHYMVATCGDDIGHTDRVWQALMQLRGWAASGAFSVAMPNTYVSLPGFDVDTPEVERTKLDAVKGRVRFVASCMTADVNVSDVTPGAMPWLKTRVLGPLFRRFLMSPGPFRADVDRCNGCGKCAIRCPMCNITMVNRHPVWGRSCAMCMACYHGCARDAVNYGCITRKKGRYRGPRV